MKTKLIITLVATTLLVSCGLGGGGGGGGGGDLEPADVFIDASPTAIDSGDRISVTVRVENVALLGIALKVKFPTELRYVRATALLDVDEVDAHFDPTTSVSGDDSNYLVFYVSQSDLGRDNQGTLTFALTGDNGVDDGAIEIDADIDDPDISNSREFDVDDPKIDAVDAVYVQVRGEQIATPTPTPTATPAS